MSFRARAFIPILCATLAVGFIGGYLTGNMHCMQRQWPADLFLLVAHYKTLEAGKTDKLKTNLAMRILGLYRGIQLHTNNPLFYIAHRADQLPANRLSGTMKDAEVISTEISKTLVPLPTTQEEWQLLIQKAESEKQNQQP